MRSWLVTFIAAGALAPATGASAQATYSVMSPPTPMAQSQPWAGNVEVHPVTLPSPYARKLAFLQNKLLFTKAKDGGHLTPDHAAALQRELDALNRQSDRQRN
jgi:hypothetical protein